MAETTDAQPPGLLTGQALHATGLAILLAGTILFWRKLGSVAPVAFYCAIAVPIAHQVFVWLCWRLQLRSGLVARTLGFNSYQAIFGGFFIGRFISLGALGWLDRGSLGLPMAARVALVTPLTLLGGYTVYSTLRYFGHERAVGADHFDPRYRTMPLVKEGIFRFTQNGMYAFAFLLFWAFALCLNSTSAVLVAGYSHAYIWIHYVSLEKPDMAFIYGPRT